MKHTTCTLLGLGLAALAPLVSAQDKEAPASPAAPQAEAPAAKPSAEEVKAVFSYLMGYRFGQDMAMQASTVRMDDFDKEIFFKAIEDGLKNSVDPEMESKDVAACMNALMETLQERAEVLSRENLAKGEAFLKENGAKEGVVTTKSGLQYKVLKAGEGRKYDEKTDGKSAICSVTYEGRLIDGTIFDKTDTPIDMPIDRVVPGFSEALKLMPIGSEWEVVIPASLGYGEQGPGVIGNNATLVFRLKLGDIKPGKGTSGNPIELTPEILQQLQQQGLQEVPAS